MKELATDEHYILSDTKYPVNFEYAGQDTATVKIDANNGKTIENDLIYGSVSGKKVDEDGNTLGGALNGSFSFENIPFGTWYIREIEQPTGFVLNDTVYPVTVEQNSQVVEVEIVNKHIRGNITLTKVDADYPENKLTGATFEVYKDNNGDGKLDDGDTLVGTLTESEVGIYEMKDLVYSRNGA